MNTRVQKKKEQRQKNTIDHHLEELCSCFDLSSRISHKKKVEQFKKKGHKTHTFSFFFFCMHSSANLNSTAAAAAWNDSEWDDSDMNFSSKVATGTAPAQKKLVSAAAFEGGGVSAGWLMRAKTGFFSGWEKRFVWLLEESLVHSDKEPLDLTSAAALKTSVITHLGGKKSRLIEVMREPPERMTALKAPAQLINFGFRVQQVLPPRLRQARAAGGAAASPPSKQQQEEEKNAISIIFAASSERERAAWIIGLRVEIDRMRAAAMDPEELTDLGMLQADEVGARELIDSLAMRARVPFFAQITHQIRESRERASMVVSHRRELEQIAELAATARAETSLATASAARAEKQRRMDEAGRRLVAGQEEESLLRRNIADAERREFEASVVSAAKSSLERARAAASMRLASEHAAQRDAVEAGLEPAARRGIARDWESALEQLRGQLESVVSQRSADEAQQARQREHERRRAALLQSESEERDAVVSRHAADRSRIVVQAAEALVVVKAAVAQRLELQREQVRQRHQADRANAEADEARKRAGIAESETADRGSLAVSAKEALRALAQRVVRGIQMQLDMLHVKHESGAQDIDTLERREREALAKAQQVQRSATAERVAKMAQVARNLERREDIARGNVGAEQDAARAELLTLRGRDAAAAAERQRARAAKMRAVESQEQEARAAIATGSEKRERDAVAARAALERRLLAHGAAEAAARAVISGTLESKERQALVAAEGSARDKTVQGLQLRLQREHAERQVTQRAAVETTEQKERGEAAAAEATQRETAIVQVEAQARRALLQKLFLAALRKVEQQVEAQHAAVWADESSDRAKNIAAAVKPSRDAALTRQRMREQQAALQQLEGSRREEAVASVEQKERAQLAGAEVVERRSHQSRDEVLHELMRVEARARVADIAANEESTRKRLVSVCSDERADALGRTAERVKKEHEAQRQALVSTESAPREDTISKEDKARQRLASVFADEKADAEKRAEQRMALALRNKKEKEEEEERRRKLEAERFLENDEEDDNHHEQPAYRRRGAAGLARDTPTHSSLSGRSSQLAGTAASPLSRISAGSASSSPNTAAASNSLPTAQASSSAPLTSEQLRVKNALAILSRTLSSVSSPTARRAGATKASPPATAAAAGSNAPDAAAGFSPALFDDDFVSTGSLVWRQTAAAAASASISPAGKVANSTLSVASGHSGSNASTLSGGGAPALPAAAPSGLFSRIFSSSSSTLQSPPSPPQQQPPQKQPSQIQQFSPNSNNGNARGNAPQWERLFMWTDGRALYFVRPPAAESQEQAGAAYMRALEPFDVILAKDIRSSAEITQSVMKEQLSCPDRIAKFGFSVLYREAVSQQQQQYLQREMKIAAETTAAQRGWIRAVANTQTGFVSSDEKWWHRLTERDSRPLLGDYMQARFDIEDEEMAAAAGIEKAMLIEEHEVMRKEQLAMERNGHGGQHQHIAAAAAVLSEEQIRRARPGGGSLCVPAQRLAAVSRDISLAFQQQLASNSHVEGFALVDDDGFAMTREGELTERQVAVAVAAVASTQAMRRHFLLSPVPYVRARRVPGGATAAMSHLSPRSTSNLSSRHKPDQDPNPGTITIIVETYNSERPAIVIQRAAPGLNIVRRFTSTNAVSETLLAGNNNSSSKASPAVVAASVAATNALNTPRTTIEKSGGSSKFFGRF